MRDKVHTDATFKRSRSSEHKVKGLEIEKWVDGSSSAPPRELFVRKSKDIISEGLKRSVTSRDRALYSRSPSALREGETPLESHQKRRLSAPAHVNA